MVVPIGYLACQKCQSKNFIIKPTQGLEVQIHQAQDKYNWQNWWCKYQMQTNSDETTYDVKLPLSLTVQLTAHKFKNEKKSNHNPT